ncbi:MAG: sulfatase-like hydrolase/transferase [Kiritimatiellae bacterium]|jgi:arylsulfatase A-like enzyme|nr:sulfatase-like hydrolase/transferase [Kiritimatiellia bacterium]
MKLLLFGLMAIGLNAVAAAKPNLLIIYTDDQGYGDVSAYRQVDVRTPNIDRIAEDGMQFMNMRANCTVCSPSRAALLTGCYPDRVGVPGVIRTKPENSWGYFDPSVPTLADELKKCGYHTAIIGKWHLGLESPNTPNERGFDLFHGFLGDMMDDYYTHQRQGHNYMRLNQKEINPEGHATDIFTGWAVDYFKDRKDKVQPFFLYLAYNAPHFPIQPPDEWVDKIRNREKGIDEKRLKNVAFVEHLDYGIGKVLDALEESGLAKNTIIAFASDNGGCLRVSQNNDPWRDGKQSHYDGGIRVPFMMRWPGVIKPGSRCDYNGLNFDLFSTFIEAGGGEVAAGLDAVSLMPLLKGQKMDSGRELYFVRREGGNAYGGKSYQALIYDGWKLMQNDPFSPLELYNLKADPYEKANLITKEKKRRNALMGKMRAHIQRGGATPWQQPAP